MAGKRSRTRRREEEGEDGDRPTPPRRVVRKTTPTLVWLALAAGIWLVAVGGVGVIWLASQAVGQAAQPKKTANEIHRGWMGRSYHDWMREYPDPDRSDFIGFGGQFIYARPLAISEKTGKPCGLEVKITEGTVDWVTEYPLK